VAVIDADQVARDVVEPGEPTLEAIVAHFGADILTSDGRLDRPRLGGIVFADKAQLAVLNRITHPAILRRVGESLLRLRSEGHAWVAYEAALIVENQLAPGLSELVVVMCDPDVQHRRLMARNNLDPEQAWNRIRSQATNDQRREAADVVIDNNGGLQELLAQADKVAQAYDERFAG